MNFYDWRFNLFSVLLKESYVEKKTDDVHLKKAPVALDRAKSM